ncbi:class I SAM-dependent methyltransferase [Hyphomicrobium sp. D-2]|uniref:class I SAM-dependent methyltransferase n=1 Tax=Hyphomicrobium sp. D-2 TaxID=3041621 RepID=UPI0024566A88|nr:class I SAM-dependent methyltransferase [Hyphomicrobium sp. D-2]MDH4981867.1 class I SAM-dependent methyltransferase [Hyphomicrobium sp. D-2]
MQKRASMFVQDERGFNQIFPKRGTSVLRAQRRSDWFAKQLRDGGARHAIELGCGTGEMAFDVARACGDCQILAIDLSEKFISEAKSRYALPNLEFRVLDVLSDGLPALQRTDLFFGNGVLHHLIPQLPQVLRRLRELVADDGGMAFIEPNLNNPICRFLFGTSLGRRLAHLEPQEMAFLSDELRDLVANAGWGKVEIATADFLLPGLPRFVTGPSLWLERRWEDTPVANWMGQSHFLRAHA